MPQQQQTRERVFDLYLRSFSQIDVSSSPVKITGDFSDPLIEEILCLFRVDCYGTKAADSTEAAANLADPLKRRRFIAGETISYFKGSEHIWIVTTTGAAAAGGLDREVYEQAKW